VVSVKFSSKIPRPIIYFLIILLIISVIYLIYPKYQITNISGDIYKINKITGQVTRVNFPLKIRIKKSSKTLVSPDSPIGEYLQSIGKTPDKP